MSRGPELQTWPFVLCSERVQRDFQTCRLRPSLHREEIGPQTSPLSPPGLPRPLRQPCSSHMAFDV